MRAICLLLLAGAATAQDLTPRAGSGWEGFKPGSWVRIKRTPVQQGRMLTVSMISTMLMKQDEKFLTLTMKTENGLGMDEQTTNVVPRSGDAGKDEKETVEKLTPEAVFVGGKKLDCERTRTTVTGPTGKRVITRWITNSPRVWAKRTELTYDAAGGLILRSTMLLDSLAESRTVGQRKVKCLRYKIEQTAGKAKTTGEVYTSREVPGDMVWTQMVTKMGALEVTQRIEVLDFEVK